MIGFWYHVESCLELPWRPLVLPDNRDEAIAQVRRRKPAGEIIEGPHWILITSNDTSVLIMKNS